MSSIHVVVLEAKNIPAVYRRCIHLYPPPASSPSFNKFKMVQRVGVTPSLGALFVVVVLYYVCIYYKKFQFYANHGFDLLCETAWDGLGWDGDLHTFAARCTKVLGRSNWKKRWFTLHKGALRYYDHCAPGNTGTVCKGTKQTTTPPAFSSLADPDGVPQPLP